MASTCRILARSTPVAEVLEAEAPAGFALAELLSTDGRYHVEVDGVVLPEPHQYVLRPADQLVTIVGVPRDPFSIASAIYGALTAIGVGSSVAYGVGLVVGAVVSFTATYGAAIAAIASIVTVATMDTPGISQPSPPERQNALTGTNNRFAPFAPCPVVYGKRRMFPTLAAAPYTELIGQDQYLNQLFLVSLGDCDLSGLKIGEADATTFDAIEAARHYPEAPDWPTVTDQAVDIQLDDEDWPGGNRTHTATTAANSTAAAIDLNFPVGLIYTNSKGDRRKVRVHFRVEYRLQGDTAWLNVRDTAWVETTKGTNTVLGVAGPAVKLAVSSIRASTRRNIRSVGTVSSKTADSPTAGKTTITASTAIDAYTDKTYKIRRTSPTTEYAVVPASAGSSVTQWVVSNADAAAFSVGNAIQVIDDGTAVDFQIYDRVASAFRLGLKWPLSSAGTYEIRVTRTFLQQDDPFTDNDAYNPDRLAEGNKYQQILYWTVLHSYGSRQAVALPAGVDATFLSLRIKATDQLNGQLDDVSVLAERKLRTWTGSAWAGPSKTRSPAWAALDMLVNPAVNQRGYGETGAGDYIDLAAFKAWHDGLITTEGFRYDEVIDYPVSVYNAMRRASGVAWAGVTIPDGKFSITLDTSSSPVQMFTPRNSWGFKASKAFLDLPHCLKVQFDSETVGNRQDQILVYADGYDAGSASKFETVRLPGVTDADQAWKLGRRMLALAKLRPETFEFGCDVEHILCRRGDAILMAHDVTLWGTGSGRIETKAVDTPSAGTTTVTLDQSIVTETAKTYALRVRNTNATPPVLDEVAAVPAVANGINRQWKVTTAQAAPWRAGDLVAVGETGAVTQQLKVLDIRPTGDLRATIVAVEDAAGIYTAHTGDIPEYEPNITLPPDPSRLLPPQPTVTSAIAETGSINPDGSRDIAAAVTYGYEAAQSAGLSALLRYRATPEGDEETAWTVVEKPVADGGITLRGLERGLEYQVQVALRGANGVLGPWSDAEPVTVPNYEPAVVYDADLGAFVHAGTIKGAVIAPSASIALPVLASGKECSIFSVGGNTETATGRAFLSGSNTVLNTAPSIYAPDYGTADADQWRRLQDMRQPIVLVVAGSAGNTGASGDSVVVSMQCRYDGGSWKTVFQSAFNVGTDTRSESYFRIETVRPPAGAWSTIDLRVVAYTNLGSTDVYFNASLWWILPNLGLQGMSVTNMPSI